MKKFAIAAVLTVTATGAFAQEVPFWVIDGQVVYTGQSSLMNVDSMTVQGIASAMSGENDGIPFPGGNINWSQNYSGR